MGGVARVKVVALCTTSMAKRCPRTFGLTFEELDLSLELVLAVDLGFDQRLQLSELMLLL